MLLLFLSQIGVVIAASQALGRLFRKLGQPRVIGEMVAGIVLGPSLAGWLAPQVHHALFPEASLGLLNLTGQLGLVFYMFLVGVTLNLEHLRERQAVALLTSFTSIALPFVSGFLLASFLYRTLSSPNVSWVAFSLFFAVCMSITAFPVLARILRETGLFETPLGSVAIACAAVDDVSAWLILAAILGFVRAPVQHWPLWVTFTSLGGYLAIMLLLRRFLARLADGNNDSEIVRKHSSALLVAILSSIATEWIGIHALFGAFFAGVVMPKKPHFVESVRRTVEPFTTVVLLPLFFAVTGLRTRFGLVLGKDAWIYAVLIIIVAVAGKWLGAMLAARWMGMSHRAANALGILMNTRGLVELVILNIGFELGLLSPTVFSMMVMMALTTTLMTAPLVRRVHPAGFGSGRTAGLQTTASR